jgi:NAD(P)-dependent dehydrogenase (short-subunit alcohol dehydrogenase family)
MRSAFVSGAAGGIGSAIARRLLADGLGVALVDRDAVHLAELERELAASREGAFLCVPADARSDAELRDAVERTLARFGRLDVVCANAGIFRAPETPLVDVPWPDVEELVDVNLLGTIRVLRATLPHVEPGGSIVITSSTSGLQAHPGGAVYAATKTGLIGLARSLAAELSPRRIRVNCVCPGAVETRMLHEAHTPEQIRGFERDSLLGRIADPRDVAAAFAYLASEDSRHVTGVALRVDGGDCVLGAI